MTLALTGCADDGDDGPPGPRGLGAATELNIQITDVEVDSPPVVEFRVTDQDGIPVTGLDVANLRFTIAKLDTSQSPSAWVSYVNREEDTQSCLDDPPPGPNGCGPGSAEMPPATAVQATRDQDGALKDNLNGDYEYTFATDITNVTTPVAVGYDANAAHRLGIQTRGELPPVNATYNFVPATGATTGIPRRDIVLTETCNSCHNKLEAHDAREEVEYCVTCHNPGSEDANSGNTVDFKVMIHKLHRGENLPSVDNGGEYAIWGFRNSKHDYSDVVFPQDIRACQTCHVPDPDNAPQAGNWETSPSIAACGACHDDIDFSVNGDVTPGGHPGGVVDETTDCLFCHQAGRIGNSVAESHTIPERVAAERFQWNIENVDTSGATPVIQFTVTDPTNGNARYDILNDDEFTSSATRVAILIGWDSRDRTGQPTLQVDFDNAGSGDAKPGQPILINPLVAAPDPERAVDLGNNLFQVTSSTALPGTLTGQHIGAVAIEGHPAAADEGGMFTLSVPVPSAIQTFEIGGAAPAERRQVVSTAKCNQCHYALSMHGGNRNVADELMCVICHNPSATDAGARPSLFRTGPPDRSGDPATITADGKRDESIDMKFMIHAIHAGAQSGHGVRENGLVVWGYPGWLQVFGPPCNNTVDPQCEHDFGQVRYPGILSDCETCHLEGTYELDDTWELPTQDGVRARSTDTHPGATDQATLTTEIANQATDVNISPTGAVCSACHDSLVAQTHMTLNGAIFGTIGDAVNPPSTQADIDGNVEACAVCHGPGRGADVAQVHEIN